MTTLARGTEAKVTIDNSVGRGIFEFEFECSDFSVGTGWNIGLAIAVDGTKYRQVFYTERGSTGVFNSINNLTITLETNTVYKVRLDTSAFSNSNAKGLNAYVNDELIYTNENVIAGDNSTPLSNLWTTTQTCHIKAIRYKKTSE